MIDWELRPLEGLGPLDFGTPAKEVDRKLGPARFEKRHGEADFRQYRGKGERGYDVILGFDPQALTDGTFPAQANSIHVRGIRVFETDPVEVVAALKAANGGSYGIYDDSMFAFDRLGIVLNDWLDPASSDRWLAAGSKAGYAIMTGGGTPDDVVT